MKKTVTAVSSQTSPYLALFNNLPVFICIIDNHRRIVFLNKKSKRHYHAREGDYCYTSLVGRNKPCPGCTVERLSCDKVINQDWISPKGNLQLVMGTPFKKFGASRLSLKLGVDISKYKKTERQLDNYRQLNEDLINFLPDMTFAINTKGKVIAWNHAIEEYLGIKAKDIMGKGNEMYSYAFYRKRRPVLIDLVLRSKVELSKEYLLIKREHGALVAETFIPTLRGGVYLWGKASLIYDSQGTVIGAIESIRDITAQKSSENALRLSEERYRTIFESTETPFAIVNEHMIVTRVNSAFKKVFGYNNTDVLKHGPISDLFPQQELERIVKYHRLRFISPELVPSQYETQMIAKDKTVRDIIITVAVFPASRDKIISLLDITQRKRNEERLKHQQEQLEISQRELKAFSARLLQVREEEKKKIASDLHDEVGAMAVSLNTYLALAQADLKERDYENAIFHTSKIQSSLKHSIANLKRQAIDLRPPELDIIGLPTAMQQYSQRMLAKANIKVSFFMDIDEKTVSDASRIVLYRIAQEAVTNIIKHAQAKRVSVRLRQSGNNIYFTITDSGRGFSVKQLDRVNRGFGIRGMRERVESLGGIFDIYSKPRKGTRISVTLPIVQEA